MGALSNYLEAHYLDHTYNGLAFTPPAEIYIALYASDPTDADVGTELNTGSYARVRIYPHGGGSPAFTLAAPAGAGTVVTNVDPIDFPTATVPWGTVTHFGIRDAAIDGNLLHHGALDDDLVVRAGDICTIAAGALKLRME